MTKKAIVLLSGGFDSALNLSLAVENYQVVQCLFFDFGQKARLKEEKAVDQLCHHYKVSYQKVSLPWMRDITKTSLVNPDVSVPLGDEVDIQNDIQSAHTASQVWVPNRNGVFLNVGASFAESYEAHIVIPGFNKEEASTFPDNSEEFLDQSTKAFSYSTQNKVEVRCFTTYLTKAEMVSKALSMNLPFEKIWSCYQMGEKPCGQCESCKRLNRALVENGSSLLEVYQ